jgi:hypothetical protein
MSNGFWDFDCIIPLLPIFVFLFCVYVLPLLLSIVEMHTEEYKRGYKKGYEEHDKSVARKGENAIAGCLPVHNSKQKTVIGYIDGCNSYFDKLSIEEVKRAREEAIDRCCK